MSISPLKNGKFLFPRRIIAQILIFLALSVILALLLQPLQEIIKKEISNIRDNIIHSAETALGCTIQYSSIRPWILYALDIRGIRIMDNDSRQLVTINHLRVSYSLWDLVFKNTRAINSVLLDRPLIDFDVISDSYLIDNIKMLGGGSEKTNGNSDPPPAYQELLDKYIPHNANFKIRGARLNIFSGENHFRVSGGYGDVRIAEQNISINGRITANVALRQIPSVPVNAQFNARLSGSYSRDSDTGSSRITIPFVSTDYFKMQSLAFDLDLRNDRLILGRTERNTPWDIFAVYNLLSNELTVRYFCEDLTFGDLVSFEGSMKQAESWLNFIGSGEALLFIDGQRNLKYSMDIDAAIPPSAGQGSFSIHVVGDEKHLDVSELYFLAPNNELASYYASPFQGEIKYNGSIGFNPITPNGILSIGNFTFTNDEKLHAEFDIMTQNNTINIFCQTLDFGAVSLDGIDMVITPSGKSLDFLFTALRFRNVESYSNVRLSTISVDGNIDYSPAQIQATVRLDSFSLADLEGMSRPFVKGFIFPDLAKNVLNNISITTEIFITTDFQNILYNAPRFIVAYETNTVRENQFQLPGLNPGVIQNAVGLFSISGTNSRFNLSEGRYIIDGNLLSVNGYADFTNPLDINFLLMANYNELSYLIEGIVLDKRSITIQGTHGFSVYVDSTASGSYSGFIQLENFPVPYNGGIGNLSLLASIRYDSVKLWALDLSRFDFLHFNTLSGETDLQFTGRADQNGLSVPSIYYMDRLGLLNGSALFSWSQGEQPEAPDSSLSVSGAFAMEGVNQKITADLDYSDDKFNLSIIGRGLQMGRFSQDFNNAVADADVSIYWDSVNSFQADMLLYSLTAKFQENDLRISARGHADGSELTISNLKISFSELESTIPLFIINLNSGYAQTNASIRGDLAKTWVDGLFSLETNFRPVDTWLDMGSALNEFNGRLHVSTFNYAGFVNVEPFDFIFSRSGRDISVSGGPKNMLRLNAGHNGNFYFSLTGPSPVRGSVTGRIENNTINAFSNDLYVDLEKLWQLIPVHMELILAGGYATAEIEIRGSLSDPEFFGLIHGNSVRMQVPSYVTSDIRPVPFTAIVDGNEIRLNSVPVSVGPGAGFCSGWFRIDRWIPNIFQLDITVPPQTPIPFGFDITGLLANGYASGLLVLSMEDLIFNVRGDLYANNTEIGLNANEIIAKQQAGGAFSNSQRPVTVDMKLSTGPTVEFLWPSSNIPILRLNPDIGTNVKITADSAARQYSITSDIGIRSGEIYYFERSFYIRSGLLSFRESELRFAPLLTVRAEARDRNDEGPVIISMIVDNAPLLSFTARFESRPSLSQTEIFALMGQNLTGSQVDENTGNLQRAFLGSSVDALAQFVVVRQVERYIRRFTRLDMFSFRTQLLQNTIFNAAGLNPAPVDRNAGVGNYFDNTTVFIGKYIGADMFAQTMVAMRYDEYRNTGNGYRFEWDVGIELESPLFNIRWDFVPSNPQNWWVSDNSITITWNKTY